MGGHPHFKADVAGGVEDGFALRPTHLQTLQILAAIATAKAHDMERVGGGAEFRKCALIKGGNLNMNARG